MRYFVLILMAAALVTTTSCGGPTGPDHTEIESYLEDRISQSLDVNELRCETFMDQSSSSGRLSCAGQLILNVDFYKQDPSVFQADLDKALGDDVEPSMKSFFIRNASAGSAQFPYKVVIPAGTTVPFRADLNFLRVIDGWKFSGRPKYRIPGDPTPRSNFLPGSMSVGDPEYKAAIQRVVKTKQKYESVEKKLANEIKDFFSPNEKIVVYVRESRRGKGSKRGRLDYVNQKLFTISDDYTVTWSSNASMCNVSGTATWNMDGRWDTMGGKWTDSQFAVGKVTPVRLHCKVTVGTERYDGNYIGQGYLEIRFPGHKRFEDRTFNTDSFGLTWKGGHFDDTRHIAKHE